MPASDAHKRIIAHITTLAAPPPRPKSSTKKHTLTKKPFKLNRKQIERWRSMSIPEQTQYLEKWSNSVFKKLGINKPSGDKKPEAKKPSEDKKPDVKKKDKNADNSSANPLGVTIKKRSKEEINKHMARMRQLRAEKAMERGSKEREMSASLIEKNGSAIAKETLNPDQQKQVLDQYTDIKATAMKNGSDPNPAKDRTDGVPEEAPSKPTEDLKKDDKTSEKTSPGKQSRRFSTLAYFAGAVAAAALVGGAVFAVNPAMAMYLGYHFLDKLPDMMNAVIGRAEANLTLSADEESTDMDEMFLFLSDYVRDGDLPHDILDKLDKELTD